MQLDENFLEHFGVKGMKWGVRRKSGSDKAKSSGQTAKTLTNKELKKRVNRLNMEKRYSQLSKETNRESMSQGKKVVNDIVENFAKEYRKNFGKKAGKRGAALTVNIMGDIIEKRSHG